MIKNDMMVNNENNNNLEIEILKSKKEYYVKELEKCKDIDDDMAELINQVCSTLTVGVLFLGAMVASGVNTFSDDLWNSIFATIGFLVSGIVGAHCTFTGFKALIKTMSTLSTYTIANGDIQEKLELLEIELNLRENGINVEDKKGKEL